MADDAIAFKGRMTWAEFRHVQHRLQPAWNQWRVIGPLLVVFMLWLLGDVDAWQARPTRFVLDLALALGLLMLALLISRGVQYVHWKKQLALHGDMTGTLSEAGLRWTTNLLSAEMSWDKLVGHKIDAQVVLLLYAPRCAYVLPRSFFAEEQDWLDLQAMSKRRSKSLD